MMENKFGDWLSSIVNKKVQSDKVRKRQFEKLAVGNHRQDESRPILENLATEGYDTVTWDAGNSVHSVCRELDNQQWTLESFLSGLNHDAPIFERSHPGDENCRVVVSGPNLPNVIVDSFGNITQI